MHFHAALFGKQDAIWSKQHNGKVTCLVSEALRENRQAIRRHAEEGWERSQHLLARPRSGGEPAARLAAPSPEQGPQADSRRRNSFKDGLRPRAQPSLVAVGRACPGRGSRAGIAPVWRGARDSPREEEGCNSSARRSKAKNVPAVGKRSRAIRPLPMSSGIIAPVSKRG